VGETPPPSASNPSGSNAAPSEPSGSGTVGGVGRRPVPGQTRGLRGALGAAQTPGSRRSTQIECRTRMPRELQTPQKGGSPVGWSALTRLAAIRSDSQR